MGLRVRGRLLSQLDARFDALPGGRERAMSMVPTAVRERLEPIWIATGWYDAEIAFAFSEAQAAALGAEPTSFVRLSAERAAEQDIRGIYRHQLRPASPADMADRLSRIFNRYYDAPLRVLASTAGSLTVEFSGIPVRRAAFFEAVNEGFMGAALRLAGAQDLQFAWTRRVATVSDEVVCELEVTWTDTPT